tara:strand:+ start:384 stop:854 length:471 start_codon:yes stop_codon:yes gene_type:complete
MSSVVLAGSSSGTITIAAPAAAGTNTLTLPASTGTVATTTSATALSTASGSAPSYSARAWVSFNGTGTVAIRGSGNVSSITDNGIGDYTVNFTTAMPDTNYAAIFTPQDGTAGTALVGGCTHTKAVGSVKCWAAFVSSTVNKTLYDTDDNNVVIMR